MIMFYSRLFYENLAFIYILILNTLKIIDFPQ